MVDYEKGSPSWDIGMVLTRHAHTCAKSVELRRSVGEPRNERADKASHTPCTCGAGASPTEETRYAAIRRGMSPTERAEASSE